MQQRIEEHPDFSTIQDNPIELLKVIKLAMHDPIRARYLMASMTNVLWRMINIKQFVNENLIEYAKRFKQTRDVMRSSILVQKFWNILLYNHLSTKINQI